MQQKYKILHNLRKIPWQKQGEKKGTFRVLDQEVTRRRFQICTFETKLLACYWALVEAEQIIVTLRPEIPIMQQVKNSPKTQRIGNAQAQRIIMLLLPMLPCNLVNVVVCLMVHLVETVTPVGRIWKRNTTRAGWSWNTSPKQHNFTCEANQRCSLVNLRFSGVKA